MQMVKKLQHMLGWHCKVWDIGSGGVVCRMEFCVEQGQLHSEVVFVDQKLNFAQCFASDP